MEVVIKDIKLCIFMQAADKFQCNPGNFPRAGICLLGLVWEAPAFCHVIKTEQAVLEEQLAAQAEAVECVWLDLCFWPGWRNEISAHQHFEKVSLRKVRTARRVLRCADAVTMTRCGFPALSWALLLVLGSLNIDAVKVQQEVSFASRRNPIAKVTAMLESLEKKVRSEGDEKKKVYDKYMCYCKDTSESLNLQLAEAAKSLPQLRSQAQEVSALQISLESEIGQHKKDRDEAKSAISSAAEIRKKEADAFLKDSQSQQESVDSLTAAIQALQQNRAASFLQTTGAVVLRRLSLSADMTTRNRDLLASFLSSGVPSDQVLGMLKQMKEDMGSDLEDMKSTEKKRLAEHASLMEAKRKQQEVAMKAMEEKMLRLGELKVEQQVLQDDLKDQTEAQKENSEFATALKKTCEEKEKAWSQYQASQAEELQALTETVDFLSKDQVRDTIRDATSTALLSTRARTSVDGLSPVPAALSFMQVSESQAIGDSLEQALRGQGGRGMGDVLRHIDDLHDVLDQEQASDEDRQKYCETKLRQATAAKSNKQREAEDAKSIIATYQNELDTVVGQIGSLKARMEDLDKQVAKTTSARQAERTAFEKSRDTNHAALELLAVAEKRLERFYATSLVQASDKALGQVASAQDTSSSLAASRSRSPPPTADLSYQTQGGGATRVLQLFNTIKADVQKQNAMLESEDAIGQSEYENLVKNSNEKKMADNRSLGSKEAAKAELEADLQRSRQGLRSLNEVLTALDEEIRTLHKQCDFLLKNFDLREDARRAEKRSLTRAKAVLEAAA
ncbi:unnamed protein product [Cladocopium goreaui]|uniref:Uncharacterized protein n=1 Tax=Cladocopium goreaui TaxID=2562237 RepID=A0A9P1GL18_9DINO|nr:unnamed protein product [Cladocopium goreaui]